jgi:hypothetical protein
MTTRNDNGVIYAELRAALARLCEGCLPAVRVACVPSGLDYRFVISVEAGWRAQVYTALAPHTRIPPDAGPLNLSRREALRLCELAVPGELEPATRVTRAQYRQPRRLAVDLMGPLLGDTFQP